MKNNLLLILILLACLSIESQEKILFIDIDTILEESSDGLKPEDYKINLELISKINENDSSYCAALVTKSYYLLNLEKYNEAIKVADQGLNLKCYDDNSSFYINKGLSFIYLKEYNKALKTCNQGLESHPKNHVLWHNKGVIYEKLDQIENAIKAYQIAITYKPTYAKSHFQLGNICYKQKRISQALMCYNLYLLLTVDEPETIKMLLSLNNLVSEKNNNDVNSNLEISVDDEAFDELDLILDNKIALNKKYKTGNKIDISLTKQNHVLLEKLKDFKGNGGFWDTKYVTLFKWISDNNYFDDFTYTISYSIENEKYKKVIKSNEKKIIEFLSLFYKKWPNILSTNNLNFEGKKLEVSNYYYNSYLQAVGKTENEKPIGSWKIYNEDGKLTSYGSYDTDGKRSKKWTWLHKNNQIKEIAYYKAGELNGENLEFFDNGKPYVISKYKNEKLDGEYLLFNDKGALIQKKYFKNGELDGLYKSFFNVGESLIEWNIPYANGKIEPVATEYYANGDIFKEMPFVNGKRQGVEKKYYFNKQISTETHYTNGKLNGPFKTYHRNGNTYEEGNSLDNFYHGPWKTYYQDGVLESDFSYDHGYLDGLSKHYDTDGKLHYEFLYKKGEVIEYKYLDKAGNVIKEARKKGGEFQFTGYSTEGIKFSEGLYDIKGGKEGLWSFYSDNGVLTNKGKYVDNKIDGEYTSYHNNGEIESVSQYRNDSLTDYFASYYKNGQLKKQGWYKNNLSHGEWRSYYIDGTLEEINFYHKNQLHGNQELYSVDGKIKRIYVYKFGKLYSETYFDVDGKSLGEINYRPSENNFKLIYKHSNDKIDLDIEYANGLKHGKYIGYYFSGKKRIQGQYKNGEQDGKWIWYYENGNKRIIKHYRNGTLDGEYTSYHENGQLDDKDVYAFGKIEGTSVSYHENGKQSDATTYENGKIHGKKIFYDWFGNIQLIRFYNHGRLIGYSYLGADSKEVAIIPIAKETGILKAYFDNGKVSRELEYKNGDLVNTYKEYYYSGQLESLINYKSNDFDGVMTTYYPNGNKKGVFNYQYDTLQGLATKYYENGNIKEEVNYKNNNKNGIAKYYNSSGKLIRKDICFDDDVYESKTF
ncbi:tetratricopeptide repeat protein [uncultured Algibacter sp.]|uniref:tetratricopeptide repeat protein n=1 Tax=uncultured Algibacter sp. TaxID=298659 RepID=UPI003216A80D